MPQAIADHTPQQPQMNEDQTKIVTDMRLATLFNGCKNFRLSDRQQQVRRLAFAQGAKLSIIKARPKQSYWVRALCYNIGKCNPE